ncbi:acyl-ACP--UDP-N-acetylglucosamine O-acyltransferase [Alteromonas sediminis]|uniref:Acyl-[acyl-carrier-protein]--UDP-N-acetylglucosamine O-acyltransferase n=1 Tax=Alteromonas sediminis TaxID=2259342 RepID=A0A3N5ZAZ1_9ALTE|nr:acyl-ACP--UDP-N-acetylglucosamine O-acyltransferase [Alteromonas sediminis]RPJ68374.1 acyl-ACP--UDP-N-acetylglucosamine O-acyltransferase [Alteromonas sediminis]
MIHETAIVSEHASIGENVTIGPYCVIDGDVSIGDNCVLHAHVVMKGKTRIGRGNQFFQFTSIGEDCQDKKYKGEPTELVIGDNNVFREGATVHRGTIQDEGITKVGSNNLVMVNAHIAHDCRVGNDVILANNVALAGHVTVEDYAIMGGGVAVHQFCRIGAHAFMGGGGIILRDVPPFVMVSGTKHIPQGINSEGLRRRGFGSETITAIKRAYKTLYREGNTLEEAINKIASSGAGNPEIGRLLTFLAHSERGIIR